MTAVPEALLKLRQEHGNMTLLLDMLERQIALLREGESADLKTVKGILDYFLTYPDLVHHPKEDRIYAELKAVRPDQAAGMSRVSEDHRLLAELGNALRADIERIIGGDSVRRSKVVGDASRYIETLRSHMHWEESDLFRRVDRMIQGGHDTVDTSVVIDSGDPLFGDRIGDRYQRLYDSLVSRQAPTDQ